jgi:hypothetical protein
MERTRDYFECDFCKGFFGVGSRATEANRCSYIDDQGNKCDTLVGRYKIVEEATEWLSLDNPWWHRCPEHRPYLRRQPIRTVKDIIKLLLETGQATFQEFEVKHLPREFIEYCLEDP